MTMKKGNIIIQYQIDLEIYKKVRKEKYYHFSLRREDEEYVRILFNGQRKSLFTIKKLLHKIEAVKQKLYNDFKILYPDYEQLKNLDYLERKLVSL